MSSTVHRARRATAKVAVVAALVATSGALAAPAQAAPPTAAPAGLTLPWGLSWSGGKAAGTYTVVQPPLGVGRTYSVGGVVVSLINGQCYFVQVSGEGVMPPQNSPASCGPAQPAAFTLKVQTFGAGRAVGLRLCRAMPAGTPACGPTTRI